MSSDCSRADIFFRTSRAASRSVGVSCAATATGVSRTARDIETITKRADVHHDWFMCKLYVGTSRGAAASAAGADVAPANVVSVPQQQTPEPEVALAAEAFRHLLRVPDQRLRRAGEHRSSCERCCRSWRRPALNRVSA